MHWAGEVGRGSALAGGGDAFETGEEGEAVGALGVEGVGARV